MKSDFVPSLHTIDVHSLSKESHNIILGRLSCINGAFENSLPLDSAQSGSLADCVTHIIEYRCIFETRKVARGVVLIHNPAVPLFVRVYAENNGTKVVNGMDITVDVLKQKLQNGDLVILAGELPGAYHAILLTGYDQDGFKVCDPLYKTKQNRTFDEILS